ncbi:hypothetical protein ACJX0J_007114, partial [Zea mays]
MNNMQRKSNLLGVIHKQFFYELGKVLYILEFEKINLKSNYYITRKHYSSTFNILKYIDFLVKSDDDDKKDEDDYGFLVGLVQRLVHMKHSSNNNRHGLLQGTYRLSLGGQGLGYYSIYIYGIGYLIMAMCIVLSVDKIYWFTPDETYVGALYLMGWSYVVMHHGLLASPHFGDHIFDPKCAKSKYVSNTCAHHHHFYEKTRHMAFTAHLPLNFGA